MLETATRAHFIGIGGAGMSAIAKVLLERGVTVTGSDLKRSGATTVLAAMGAEVHIGHDASVVPGDCVVVVSAAIPSANPELMHARSLGLPIVSRGEALAAVLRGRKGIIVAGTHGKTTTTSMITTVLRRAGLDPTYLIGGGLNDAGTNAKSGRGDIAVAESDESDGSFLLLSPYVAVVTNVEVDHVDYWQSLDGVLDAFETFVGRTDPSGAVVVPASDPALGTRARKTHPRIVTFGDSGDVRAHSVALAPFGSRFTLETAEAAVEVDLRVPGRHNVANALAAAAACRCVGVDASVIAEGLASYRGVERRFQLRGTVDGITVVDDYAHHPTEVRATLEAATPGPWSRVVAVFQPHRYTRTAAFGDEFGASFAAADRIVVTDVYGAGEEPVPGVTGRVVADAVCAYHPGRPVAYFPHRSDLVSYLAASARFGDLVLTLGAGDITSVGEELLARLGEAR